MTAGHRRAQLMRPLRVLVSAIAALGVLVGVAVSASVADASPGCSSNAIVCENAQPGTPADQWDVDGVGDPSIQGFGTAMSVDAGERIDFKIDTDASAYGIQIVRLGWYAGLGARKVDDVVPSAALPQIQPACATDPATEIYDCGTWGVSASWDVPDQAVSGIYLAVLTRTDTGGRSQIPFVVRNDASTSAAVFQTSDATWQAYNTYGGSNFYTGQDHGRAYKLSYNRPFLTRGLANGRDYLFANEYPMLRFLERNGYDLSYISSLDTDIRGASLTQHKLFISTGHDEYWSQGQRANVEAARDAGVHLAFFSGNEVYWKTRWEPSQDGSDTANRTLVCYKDTWNGDTPLDPVSPTSTWRDARGAGRPENALTGTIYKSNDTDLAITVSGAEGKLRLWRNTGLGDVADTASTALAAHTVGYESDEDLDNGFRPAGLFRLSTTTGPTPQYLTDFGTTVVPGTTTHHLTLYKAASGALVFGAGTVQWAWGLDTYHDGEVEPVDVRMQQAMINLFADMTVQPASLSTPGLVPATASTDSTAPTTTITAPAAGAALEQGSSVTVTGTATDADGEVAGVEVSLDAGRSWHPATGRTEFSYTGILAGSGTGAIRVRAVDDSGNLQDPATTLAAPVNCPCTLFGATVPETTDVSDDSAITLGVRFSAATDGFVTGIRFYKGAGNTGTHTGTLYATDGSPLATVTFTDETASGWQTATFSAAVPVTAGTSYVAAYTAPNGHYAADSWFFGYGGVSSGPLSAAGGDQPNGVWGNGASFPNNTYRQTNYYVDLVFAATDPTPLRVVTTSPIDDAGSVPTEAALTAKLSRDPATDSISTTLTAAGGGTVAGTTTYDAATRTVTFTPNAPLAAGTRYSATLTASAAAAGVPSEPGTWSFTTARAPQMAGVCPCSLYDDTDVPATAAAADPDAVELGTAFTSDTAGQITGVEFYKGVGNTGTHTISLWTTDGERLATAEVGSETSVGWQRASFAEPVTIAAGTTYIASYRAPRGHYAVTAGALGSPIDRAPLHTPAGAGRYGYGSGAPLTGTTTSYSVDPVFTTSSANPPTVASVTPSHQTTSTPVGTAVTVTFDGTVRAGTAVIELTDPAGHSVAGSTANQTVGAKATFTPTAALAAGTTYTVTVSGAKNLGGTPMADPATSTFTTSGPGVCPCTLLASSAKPAVSDAGDAGPITVGTRFAPTVNGFITGLRYWRDAANTGTHTGAMYSTSGQRLADITFDNDGTGWQTATLDTAVPVTAGTSYVVAVFMPNGHYAAATDFFADAYANPPLTGSQGVYVTGADAFPTSSYRNTFYYVDPVFELVADHVAPAISAVKASAADGKATITWTTDEPASGSVAYGSSEDKLTKDAAGADALRTDHTATITGLTVGDTYAFAVRSTDEAGNVRTAPASSFTVADATAPAISDVVVASTGGTATITWTTDESATGAVAYGTAAGKLDSTVEESGTGTEHRVKITGLTVGTTYSFRVTSADQSENKTTRPASSADPATWTQQPVTVRKTINDTDASISYQGTWTRSSKAGFSDYNDDVNTTKINGATATFTFTGIGVSVISATSPDQGTASVAIDGGKAVTVDAAGTNRKSQQEIFTSGDLSNGKHTVTITKLSGTSMIVDAFAVVQIDTAAPVISKVTAAGAGGTATVTWKTDEPSSTSVAYGTSASAMTKTAGDDGGTDHAVELSGLKAGTTYYYKATSADENGNTATSAVGSFVPAVPTKTINDDDAAISYSGTWKRSTKRGFGDVQDDVSTTATNGASATLTFTGTAVTVVTEKSADQGNVGISVDGGASKTVSLAASSRKVQQAVFTITGLSSARHAIKITKLSGTNAVIDAFVITPSTTNPKIDRASRGGDSSDRTLGANPSPTPKPSLPNRSPRR